MVVIETSTDGQWVTVCLDDGTTAVLSVDNKLLK